MDIWSSPDFVCVCYLMVEASLSARGMRAAAAGSKRSEAGQEQKFSGFRCRG